MKKISRCAVARYARQHELGIRDTDMGEFERMVNAHDRRECGRIRARLYRRYGLVAILVNNEFAERRYANLTASEKAQWHAAAVRIRKQKRRAKVAA